MRIAPDKLPISSPPRAIPDWTTAAGYLARGGLRARTLTEEAARIARPLLAGSSTGAIPGENALLALDEESALRAADATDARVAEGRPLRPLDGLPIMIKDNFMTAGLRSTCGSALLADFVPPYGATAVVRLRDAGAAILGKSNLD